MNFRGCTKVHPRYENHNPEVRQFIHLCLNLRSLNRGDSCFFRQHLIREVGWVPPSSFLKTNGVDSLLKNHDILSPLLALCYRKSIRICECLEHSLANVWKSLLLPATICRCLVISLDWMNVNVFDKAISIANGEQLLSGNFV